MRVTVRVLREMLVRLNEGAFSDSVESLRVKVSEQESETFDQFVTLISADPNTSKPDYLRWGWKQVQAASQAEKNSIIDEVSSLLKTFGKVKGRLPAGKRDLNSFKTLGDLRGEIESLGKSRSESESVASSGSILVGSSGGWKTYKVVSKEASCRLGRGTKWCIAATQSKNYFDDYFGEGTVFFFVIPPSGDNKFAFAFMTDNETGDVRQLQVFDAQDDVVADSRNPDLEDVRDSLVTVGAPPSLASPIFDSLVENQKDLVDRATRVKEMYVSKKVSKEDLKDPFVLDRIMKFIQEDFYDSPIVERSDPRWPLVKTVFEFSLETNQDKFLDLIDLIFRPRYENKPVDSSYTVKVVRFLESEGILTDEIFTGDLSYKVLLTIFPNQISHAPPEVTKVILELFGHLSKIAKNVLSGNFAYVSYGRSTDGKGLLSEDLVDSLYLQEVDNLDIIQRMTFSEGTSPHVFEVAVDKLSAEARIWRENKIDLLSVGATLLKTVKMRSEITPKTTESVAKLLGPDGDLRLFHNPARNMLEGCKNPQWIEYWIKNGDIDFKKEAAQTPGLTIDLALDLCEDVAAVTTDPTVYRDVWGQIFRNDAVNSEHVIFDKMWEIASRPGNEGLKNYIRWRTELQGWKPPKESS